MTLLCLGVQNIALGPALPALITPNVLNVLVEKYGLKGMGENAVRDAHAAMAMA